MVTAVSMPANHGKACAIASAMRITELVPPWTQVGNVDMLNCYYAHGDDSEDVRLQVILPLFILPQPTAQPPLHERYVTVHARHASRHSGRPTA